ncbi:unnamed protein product [Rotaria sp. Silwood2]|nr:unnamed protein product [Rotaria sp. Silwood2]CAF3294028.1 unnamed protein product [Rotaria sp. Silwood2]CAF4247402.1 unnamed protein product [Rotaria sp. Silwood2]CAF4376818.1 unnamed protein product [Rotaria sp. Silwood2]
MFQSLIDYKQKVVFRRQRRRKQREITKYIIDYHLSSEESTNDDIPDCNMSSNNDNSTPLDTTTCLPSLQNDHYNEATSRIDYTIDDDEILKDDLFDCHSDLSTPLYDSAHITVKKATSQLMNFVIESNLDKSTTTKLFRLIKSLLPVSNTLPSTYNQIMKVLGQVSLFQAKYYCNGCHQLWAWKGQGVYPYDQNNGSRRVHEEVVSSGREAEQRLMPIDGIKGVSPMLQILTYPDQIIYDYMHLVCLGHMVTLIKRWLPLLERSSLAEINTLLESIRLPHNVHAKFNYSISDVSEWHAKHFRLFVLNIGLPCIVPHLPKFISSHFAIYCLAIKFLHCPESLDEINIADSFIDYYCRAAPLVFDQSIELLSLHAHLHLAEQVKRHGGLGFSSAFCFESCIRHLKKLVHGTKNLVSQVAYCCDLRSAVHRPEFRLQKSTGKNNILMTSPGQRDRH